jgi:3D (Asp-Asp-Asp) domain-containing protein
MRSCGPFSRAAAAACTLLISVTGGLTATAASASAKATQASIPEGALVREKNTFTVYEIVGGAKIPFPSLEEFNALGHQLSQVKVVRAGRLSKVPNTPKEDTLLRERSLDTVYVMENGQRRAIANPEVFDLAGFVWSNVRIVPNGGLQAVPSGPPLAARPISASGATASATKVRECPDQNAKPTGVAQATAKAYLAARTYGASLTSYQYPCGGFRKIYHHILVDSRVLPLGTSIEIFISTKRSDGKWWGQNIAPISTKKNREVLTLGPEYRGIGGGLKVTHAKISTFPSPGQATVVVPGSATGEYHSQWVEAKPRQ